MENFMNLILAGLLSSSVIATIIGFILHRAQTKIEKEVETQFTKVKASIEKEVEANFTKALKIFMSEREWREKSLAELIGPVYMHLERTSVVASRYSKTTFAIKGKSYFDAMLMKESNEKVRAILLDKGHLIPDNLRNSAIKLIAHYDLWLSRFNAKLEKDKPTADSVFDIGFTEEAFPKDALDAFQNAYESLRQELYNVKAIQYN